MGHQQPKVQRRTAEVSGLNASAKTVAAYLPRNYQVDGEGTSEFGDTTVLISGIDVAGWTFEDYVQPRLGSGLLMARETTKKESSS